MRTEAEAGAPGARRSLAARLVLVASLWSTGALVVAGFILVGLYRAAGERAFDSQLEVYQKAIIGALAPVEGEALNRPENLGEPRFSLPLSGWYWTVSEADGGVRVFSSASLVGDPLAEPDLGGRDAASAFATGPGGEEIRIHRRVVGFNGKRYVIAVAGKTETFRQEVRDFAGQVALTLAVFGIGLIGAVFLQVRIGLMPLARLSASLAAVRRGDAERIEEDLPREIAPLAVELNALILSNREIVERARTHVGNLAHALKTPLSVIANEARATGGPFADKVAEQAVLMRTQVDHHLERARMAAQRRVIGVSTPVEPALARLARAMGRIHGERGLAIEAAAPGDLRFRGEQQDLEEMAGNLMDNACKWAARRVSVSAAARPGGEGGRALFELVVDDDGPGLTAEERREAVKRGRRLDETVPGTGLGLSIVADLAALYGGRLELDDSPLGGLRARLVLPSV
ncbi:sensor histidine kinase [Polymorphum gilvum]|uniref:histidine kinase n=1 Tax=Polymorphum gilvum (strain LMG 25793 / CGMCC 1.9160 / SL003B-26A1) TaxID=991905 RepID=F2J6G1_POLGS|nr:sensor histidine kinase [Polymorphum gilvum]ADZ71335.1 ATPase, histidine kinase-, DNA gyrase B-, and HSP90-like domain protein [Polymorphum gilvum SL003B-26A1]